MRIMITVLFFIIMAVPVCAQVVLDGTMGKFGPINGPDFDIRAEYGQQAGANLFHSFSRFSINTGESATFSGPSSVQNIISRVTGGESSLIDGRLGSTIDGANLYLLNPAGIMFGPDASLDLSGSFHASTADYLRLGENERFYSNPIESEVLSTAPPAAFGFLPRSDEESIPQISLDEAELSVDDGKTISLIGGDIEIIGSDMIAPEGRINMASVASAGEVLPTESDLTLSSYEKLGEINISDSSELDLNGTPNGNIFIRGGKFVMTDSEIIAENYGHEDGGVTDIQADELSFTNTLMRFNVEESEGSRGHVRFNAADSIRFVDVNIQADTDGRGNGADFFIDAPDISLQDTLVSCISYEEGNSGNITIHADNLSLSSGDKHQGSRVLMETDLGIGNAGSVIIEATNVSLDGSSLISSLSMSGMGNGGDVNITASESVTISSGSTIHSSVMGQPGRTGNAGNIHILAKDISLTHGGVITSSTYSDGMGGDITLEASGAVRLEGADEYGAASRISSSTYSEHESAGDAGNIGITSGTLSLGDGASINAGSEGRGNAFSSEDPYSIRLDVGKLGLDSESFVSSASNFTGDGGDAGAIEITARDSVIIRNRSSVTTSSRGQGNAADITLETPRLSLESDALISSASNSEGKGGHAGTIEMTVGNLELGDGAVVSSVSQSESGGGNAGEIIINADDSVRMTGKSSLTTDAGATGGGQISVNAGNSIYLLDAGVTSSVGQGEGRGGDVTADSEFVILNHGHITANADEGDGGAIFIRAENFMKSSDSRVTATSNRGNEGTIRIEAPDTDVSGSLIPISGNPLDAGQWLPKTCKERRFEKRSRFIIKGKDATPTSPDDLQASPPRPFVIPDREKEQK
ncbi:filamentous hemagglutinin N-terminal domain-containing protein [Desulfobacterales bacterium HSG2]|nr:filamentous hemagglutinin N-terminal domain-containing protein [Desulfobacterales bacterium HSG2]